MKRVVVIGGRGFVGRRTVRCLGRVPGLSVTPASRSPGTGGVRVDLGDPATFPALDEFDCIVDCADTVAADPAGLARYCLERGLLFVESATWTPRIRDLLALRGEPEARAGTVVVGAGLFPGVSNLLAAATAGRVPGCRTLDLGVRLSPLSGAGRGVARLMARQVGTPGYRIDAGREVATPAIGDRRRLPFPSGPANAWSLGLAESAMLHESTGIPRVATYLSPTPTLLGPPLAVLGRTFVGTRPVAEWLLRILATTLVGLRTGLLRRRATAVELTAVACGGASEAEGQRVGGLVVSDGMEATACALTASVALLLERDALPRGVLLPDEVLGLDEVLERLEPLLWTSGGSLQRMEVQG